jgi:hypothetical protein
MTTLSQELFNQPYQPQNSDNYQLLTALQEGLSENLDDL